LKNPITEQLYTYSENGNFAGSIFKNLTIYYSRVYWYSQFDYEDPKLDQEDCLEDAYDEFWDVWGEENPMNDTDIIREIKKCFNPKGSYFFKVVDVQPFVPLKGWQLGIIIMFATLTVLTFVIFLGAKPYFAYRKNKINAAKKEEEEKAK
jgi:hypothetical protein